MMISNRHSSFFPLLALVLFLWIPRIASGAQSVVISSDAGGSIEVGETFHITIEANNISGNIDMNQMPKGVKVVYHTSRTSSGTSIVNGKAETKSSTALILTCKGETPGSYTFGPVAVSGVKSNVLSYKVVPASPGSNSPSTSGSSQGGAPSGLPDPNSGPVFVGKGNEEMFLRASVNKTSAYEQEALEYTVKLYTTYGDIKFMGAAAAPKFDGFVIDESDDVSKSFVFEDYNGKTFKTAVIARYIIFPQKSGKLTVKGNTYTVSTDARQYYDDPYFSRMVVKYPIQLNVTPNDVVVDVKPLPQPIPANFIGGVGSFRLSTSMPKGQLATNTAASIIYTVSGSGNIKYVKLPEISPYFPKSVEIYAPEVKVDATVGSSTVSGTARFDYSIIPKDAGVFNIPAIEMYYFDPSDASYHVLKADSFDLNVERGSASALSQQASSFNPKLLPVGKITQKVDNPYIESPFYWLWYIVPVIILVVALAGYRKYLRDHEDLTALRSKQANKMALKRLAAAYQCYQKDQEEQFYDEMLSALWGYIGDKLKMPVSELNRGNVSQEFRSHGVSESTFQPIINLIDECEYAKYTPVSRHANMRQLYADALVSLARVESEYQEQIQKSSQGDGDEGQSDGSSMDSAYVNSSTLSSTPVNNDNDSHENDK